MTNSVLNTPFATLDCAKARSILEDARSDPQRLRQALTDCFFDGSIAASETAAHFILGIADSSTAVRELPDILKSLPTAIPLRNAPALAQLCSYLASSFPEEEYRTPLHTFCFAESRVKQIAAKAVISCIDETARLHSGQLNNVLHRTRSFFIEILRSRDDVQDRLVAVRGLVRIGSMHAGSIREAVFSFLLELGSDEDPVGKNDEHSPFEHEYESFLATELVALAADRHLLARIFMRCLVRALDCSVASTVQELWMMHNWKMSAAVPLIGYDVFLYSLTSIAATNACRGRISGCRSVLFIVMAILTKLKSESVQLNEVVCSIITSMCRAIASTCAAAGTHDVAKSAASICKLLQEVTERVGSCEAVLDSFNSACRAATYWKCGNAALSLGLLQKLLTLWNQPKKVKSFVTGVFCDLLESDGLEDFIEDQECPVMGRKTSTGSMSRDAPWANSQSGSAPPNSDGEHMSSLLVVTSILLAVLSHRHPQVRYAAAKALERVRSGPSMLFFLPAIILRLQEETSGVVVSVCLQDVVLSPFLLAHQETGKVVMKTMLQLVRSPEAANMTTAYHAGLVAIAGAAKTSPGIATSVLLAEVESLKESFGLISSATKAAACAAILKITTLRPTRGASFVPFIMQCTTLESMESAPEAAAFCFDVIKVMADEDILDAVKAVKVVLKTFTDVLDVAAVARRSYLRLLGCVASRSSSQKGAVVAGRVIGLLRNSLTNLLPVRDCINVETELSWEQIDEAARALAEYDADEVLRISHAKEEPLENPDEEKARLDRITNECMEFIHSLLSAVGKAFLAKSCGALGLQKLLGTIAKHEWDNRQRSSFDPERIAKLRATSEALRRARQKTNTTTVQDANSRAAVLREDRPTAQFLRAVNTLPAGVIKALCERCLHITKAANEDDDDLKQINARAVSMRVLLQAGALSPALPWVGLVEEVLCSSSSSAVERAAALAVLTHVVDESFDSIQSREKWFGVSCPLFDGVENVPAEEAKELFAGMIVHHSAEVERLLQHLHRTLKAETIAVFIEAVKEAGSTAADVFSTLKELLQIMCDTALANDAKMEKRFVEECLTRVDAEAMRGLLIEAMPSAAAVRMASLTGDYTLLRACANVLARSTDYTVHDASVHSLGAALSCLPFEQRRAVLQDLCAIGSPGGVIKLTLAAHCLHTAALLPDTNTSLRVAMSVCKRAEREKVRTLVSKLLDKGEDG